jgi:excisionase family DNA binding protein
MHDEIRSGLGETLLSEQSFNATAVAKLCGVNVATVIRWITRGVGGDRLRAWRCGGQWRVNRQELVRFLGAITARRVKPATTPALNDNHAAQPAATAGRDAERELAMRYGMK